MSRPILLTLLVIALLATSRSASDQPPVLTGTPLVPGGTQSAGEVRESAVGRDRYPDLVTGGVPFTAIGSSIVSGTASHVGTQFGPDYLALPEHRWGKPGLLVKVCAVACVTRRSTDAGPDLAMQRAGRVVDLNQWDFERVCQCDASVGLVQVTVAYLGEIELPQTDSIGPVEVVE